MSIRRKDLETDADFLACELRPTSRRKILSIVYYRALDTDLNYFKELKKSLRLASKARFDQLLLLVTLIFQGLIGRQVLPRQKTVFTATLLRL